ncbi:NADPH dehydrogenase NamA [Anoxynatronum sibiricum]|uniref:NADPH dehydrogenase NamA n=1 Tax=Anoxynatronum sibiricum TaxID=210623 RepID=A0ABU9VVW3_9CLOT
MKTKLFSPFKLKKTTLKNRIVMAPMCQYSAGDDGYANDWHLVHYTTRAVGGAGLILLEATAVEPRGRISSQDLGIWEDSQADALRRIVNAGRRHGAVMGIQLGHAGRKCEAAGEAVIAPSALSFDAADPRFQVPKAMSVPDIAQVTASFQQAARRAVTAGFQVLEIHAAHGYLINQFLSPLANHRTDDYGGSPENRVRFLREVLAAVKEVIPEELPLIVRVSAEDYVPEGNRPEDLAALLNLAKDTGIDLVNVSSGAVVNAHINTYPGYQVRFAETIRQLTGLPVMAGGLITSPLMAEEVLQNERADLIFLGRELLRNPYWPLQAARELREELEWPLQYQRSQPKW